MAGRRCSGCPTILTNGTTTCPSCQRTKDATRGTREQRGYGKQHQQLRRKWQQRINQGNVACTRCNKPIPPGTPFDLGHNNARTQWTGPEHPWCNRSAAGKHAAKLKNKYI